MPKFNLLYFKNLLDISLCKFFELYNDDFQKINGKYVLSTISKSKLVSIFRTLIIQTLKEHLIEYDILHPNYYLIIGACNPKDNILLSNKEQSYFPVKLQKCIDSEYKLKYLLKEKDIDIDIIQFNDICLEIFNDFFAKNKVGKYFGKQFEKNVIFITHKHLDCYTMFKVLKSIFGKANCVNMYLEKFSNQKLPIVAINDLIDRYIHDKKSLNKNDQFKNIISEINNYLKLKGLQYGN